MVTKSPTSVWIVRRKGKRGTTYRLRWINAKTGKWESLACGRDKALAREQRECIRQELREGMSGKLPQTMIPQFLEQLPSLMAGKSHETVDKTVDSVRLLDELCRVGCLAAIDRPSVMAFRAKRLSDGLSTATVNKDLRQIRSALSYAVDAGLLRENPLLRWRQLMLREPEKVVRVIEEDEFGRIVQACNIPGFAAMLRAGYRQGMRRKELCNLRWTAVDLQTRDLHVVNVPEAGEFTKSRKNRTVPMDSRVHQLLAEMWATVPKIVEAGEARPQLPYVFTWPDGTPFKPDWATHAFSRLVKKAKVKHCTLHDLRRSFSTIAQRAGVDKYTVKDLGGWSVVSVVERHYTGDVSGVHRKAMDRIAGVA